MVRDVLLKPAKPAKPKKDLCKNLSYRKDENKMKALVQLILAMIWIAGIVIAKGFWSTFLQFSLLLGAGTWL